jgi:AhpD family alkylhydroperoxidase
MQHDGVHQGTNTRKYFVVINRTNHAKVSPEGFKALGGVCVSIEQFSLAKELVDPVYPRVSQINGSAYCIDMHSRDLLKSGIAVEKLVLVPVWRDAREIFGTRERVALSWAESVTLVAETGLPDADRLAAAAESDKELADLTYAIGAMNVFNRLGVAFRMPPAAATKHRIDAGAPRLGASVREGASLTHDRL